MEQVYKKLNQFSRVWDSSAAEFTCGCVFLCAEHKTNLIFDSVLKKMVWTEPTSVTPFGVHSSYKWESENVFDIRAHIDWCWNWINIFMRARLQSGPWISSTKTFFFYYASIFLCQIPQKRQGCEFVGPHIERKPERKTLHTNSSIILFFDVLAKLLKCAFLLKLVEMLKRMHSI